MSNRLIERDLLTLPLGLIAFRFAEIEDEMLAFAAVAEKHLRPESIRQMKRLVQQFSQMASATTPLKWSTMDGEPLLTERSGEFEPNNKKCSKELYGRLQFTWTIQPIGKPNLKPRLRWFALLNSSVSVELRVADSDHSVGQWDFDVGDDQSPGCHFHAKPDWKALNLAAGFAKPVPVPRLPTYLFMPTDCLEFLFGELWQSTWANRVKQSDAPMERWRKISCARHLLIAKSHYERCEDRIQSSGWMTLKSWKPNATTFASQ